MLTQMESFKNCTKSAKYCGSETKNRLNTPLRARGRKAVKKLENAKTRNQRSPNPQKRQNDTPSRMPKKRPQVNIDGPEIYVAKRQSFLKTMMSAKYAPESSDSVVEPECVCVAEKTQRTSLILKRY